MARGNTNTTGSQAASAATTNATLVKGGEAEVSQIIATNTTASLKYLKIYNKRTVPIVGTDVPLLTIALPPSNALTSIDISGNLHLDQGLGYAITGLGAASDTTAVAVGDVVGLNILYL